MTSAVSFPQLGAVERRDAARHLQPDAATARDRVCHARASIEIGDVEQRVLMQRHRAAASVGRGNQPQLPPPLLDGKSLLLVARRQAGPVRDDPDLQEMHWLDLRRIELAVLDAGAGAHALHLAGPDHIAIADTVLVLERAFENIGDDVHVLMAVAREAGARNDAILVDDPEAAKAHLRRIAIIAE